MNIDTQIGSLKEIVLWIDTNTRGIGIQGSQRNHIARGCFDVALEHQAAIALLSEAQLFGSVHAMMRILIESVVRGLWVLHCAGDDDLSKFERNTLKKHFGDMAKEVEASIGARHPTLSQMKNNAWNALNDFTHTGFIQISRRHNDESLGPNYPEKDVIKCINAACAYGLIASAQLSSMAERTDLVNAHVQKIKEYARAP